MPLDDQVRTYLDRLAELGIQPVDRLTPEEARRQAEEAAPALFGPTDEVAAVEDVDVGGVPVRLYSPAEQPGLPLIVYFHGGGWVACSVNTHDGTCRALAARSGCRVASAGYRLAPEHRFPAAVEDAWTVTRWAFEQAPAVAVAGDSAGGNLAAVMAIRARDAGLPLAFQALVYPVTDHRFDRESYTANAEGYFLTRDAMRWYWAHYLGGADGGQPEASPLRAGSLAGVAPALVVVCEYDPLRDEGVEYAARLREAGVPVALSEYEGMIHGFVRLAAVTGRTHVLLDELAAALRRALVAG
jgi:acetyl esterase/lipase